MIISALLTQERVKLKRKEKLASRVPKEHRSTGKENPKCPYKGRLC